MFVVYKMVMLSYYATVKISAQVYLWHENYQLKRAVRHRNLFPTSGLFCHLPNYANSLDPEQAPLFWRLLSPDKFCKQLWPRSGRTKCQAWSWFKLFDTQMILKVIFFLNPERINLCKITQDANFIKPRHLILTMYVYQCLSYDVTVIQCIMSCH